jgi:hypothetical protein
MQQHNQVSTSQLITISRSDRWQVHQRLRELEISSTCLRDGGLEVEIYSPLTVFQLRSVLLQFTAPRQQLADWLEQCWQKQKQ